MVYTERVAKWDNAKLILIFLVVLGHFLETFLEQYAVCRGVYVMIYLFHMPAFLFISGMFSKKTVNTKRLDWAKITPYLLLFVILDFGRFIVRYHWDPELTFRVFRITGVSWYLFALFVLIVVTHLLRKIDPKYVFFVSIGISLIIGYSKGIGYWFALYRIITMFPFFYLGYLWDPKKVENILEKSWIKILAAAVLAIYVFYCLKHPDQIFAYKSLVTAGTNYYEMEFDTAPYVVPPIAGLYRLRYYGLAFLVLFSVLAVIPKCRTPVFSEMGSRTLSVYFWHLMAVEILVHQPWLLTITEKGAADTMLLLLVLSAILTALLATRPCMFPLNWLMKPKRRNTYRSL